MCSKNTVAKYKIYHENFVIDNCKKKFEDTKGIIRSRNRGKTDNTMPKGKRTKNDLQNITHKTKEVLQLQRQNAQVKKNYWHW